MSDKRQQWNERHLKNTSEVQPKPAYVLTANVHLLPTQGNALDLACGIGGNALYMAKQGLQVIAWDYSSIAIEQLQDFAECQQVNLKAEVRDVLAEPPARENFDVIVVSHFLDRSIIPDLINALKPGGLVYYQTFIQEKVNDAGPGNPDYLLKPNELLSLFSDLQILVYREEGLVGNVKQGFRNEALLVAQKSKSVRHPCNDLKSIG